MRGVWLEQQKLTFRDDLPEPEPAPGEVLVRVLMAGICNTDIELTRGYYPYAGVPGHEFVGEVNGRRVVGEINAACGHCEPCLNDRRTHCDNRSVLGIINRNGAFAEYLTLPAANLHEVPDSVATEDAVFAEPLAAALEIQEQVKIGPGDRVLVVGDGKLGLLIAQTLRLTGCNLTLVGRHRGTAEADSIPARGFDVAVECSGNPAGFEIARRALRARGTLVMKSTYAGALTFNASALVVDEITLIGSRCGPFEPALKLLADRAIDVGSLVDGSYALDYALEAFDHAQQPGVLKVLIRVA